MKGKILRNQTLDQQVYQILRDAFANGVYKQGDRLVESAISEQLGVSRTPVREALIKLEMEGLAIRGANGVTVNLPCRAEIAESYAIRAHLEGLAAHIAANSATEEDLEKLKDVLLQEEKVEKNDFFQVIEHDRCFHDLILQTTRNNKLILFIKQLEELNLENVRLSIFSDEDSKSFRVSHQDILEAIKNHDGILAEDLAKRHFIDIGYRIYKKITTLRNGDLKHTPTKFYVTKKYEYYFK